MRLNEETMKYLDVLVRHRRALHQIPETGYQEFKTQRYIMDALAPLAPDVLEKVGITGVRAVFSASISYNMTDGKNRCIAFRADMDALPVKEATGLAFASTHEGFMHACGHDGHMAALLALGQYIATHREAIHATVVLIFQPAEETTGGAKHLIDCGVLNDPHVDAVYGMHMMPDVPLGKIGTCKGPLMASTTELQFTMNGKGAHGASPHLGIDALAAAAHLYTLMQTTLARCIDPKKPAVITIGRMEAGSQRNIIPETAHMEGIIRTLSNDVYTDLMSKILRDARAVEMAFGVTCEVKQGVMYPCTENDAALTADIIEILGDRFELQEPRMFAEDFSYYQLERPGVFVFCGCMDERHTEPLHASKFDFDEAALLYGLELYIQLINRHSVV